MSNTNDRAPVSDGQRSVPDLFGDLDSLGLLVRLLADQSSVGLSRLSDAKSVIGEGG